MKPPVYVAVLPEMIFSCLVVPTINRSSNEDLWVGLCLTGELSANEELVISFYCFGGLVFLVVLRAFTSSYLGYQPKLCPYLFGMALFFKGSEVLWFVLLMLLKSRSVWLAVRLVHTHLLKIWPVNLSARPIGSSNQSQLASSDSPGERLMFTEINLRKFR